ncbi:MAG: 16S rRNA (guanine(527)-N(7))-methyltransferase RsmG [Flavobacteriales bacterium]|nr:16S rRNA (guanine(527)-N(7))-methyltransferase RsmG [Flavobacteriales bacterium]|tara:strand:- start:229 stop:846 length:618 start_codon:yes stop_codon:yes gene_type:complete
MSVFLKYFPRLNKTQLSQLNDLKKIYKDLNKNVNVISRKSIDNINVFHILHSLSINKIIEFKRSTNIMDLGTGGGFPGIPLAITNPNVNFTLVDSIKKKTDIVNTVSTILDLNNVKVLNLRAENVEEKYDFIVSRAVTNMRGFLKLTKDKLQQKSINELKNGIIYLKGGDLSKEMKGIIHNEYSISNFFTEDYFETKKIIYIKST